MKKPPETASKPTEPSCWWQEAWRFIARERRYHVDCKRDRCRKSGRCMSDGNERLPERNPCDRPWQEDDQSRQFDLSDFAFLYEMKLLDDLHDNAKQTGLCGTCGGPVVSVDPNKDHSNPGRKPRRRRKTT